MKKTLTLALLAISTWLLPWTKTIGAMEASYAPAKHERIVTIPEPPVQVLEREADERADAILPFTRHLWDSGLTNTVIQERMTRAVAIAKVNGLDDVLDKSGDTLASNAVSVAVLDIEECDVKVYFGEKNASRKALAKQQKELQRIFLKKRDCAAFLEALYGKPPAP